jgi:hypothetical protein
MNKNDKKMGFWGWFGLRWKKEKKLEMVAIGRPVVGGGGAEVPAVVSRWW